MLRVPFSRRRLLLGFLALLPGVPACRQKRPAERKVVDLYIESDGDFLAFHPDTLTCPTGALVRLTFHHAGRFLRMSHNWVLVYPDQMEAVDKEADKKDGFVSAEDPRVIALTSMCAKGETVTTQFIAPSPGDYPFFCSTPGHAEMMNGILHVTR